MFADDRFDHNIVLGLLVKAAGDDAGTEITAIVKQDMEYWKKLGPTLKVGWRGDTELKERGLYQKRYQRLYACLNRLQVLKCKEAAETLNNLRNLWKSLPQLDDKNAPEKIGEELDAAMWDVIG
jgi:hypothetical protein